MLSISTETVVGVALLVLNLALALLLVRFVPRFWREVPWLVLLVIYFMLRVVRRMLVMSDGGAHVNTEIVLDLVLVPLLVLLILGSRQMLNGFQAMRDAAKWREEEYIRARREYDVLMRHRIANPLTVLDAGLQTMQSHPDLSPEVRAELVNGMLDATSRLRTMSTDARAISAEEQTLDATPRV